MAYRSSSYRRRVAISVVTTATASTADVEFTPHDAWDEFWAAIDASGYGIRLTEADGVTPLTYAWSGFNKTTKAGPSRSTPRRPRRRPASACFTGCTTT